MLLQERLDGLNFPLGIHRQHAGLPVGTERIPGGGIVPGTSNQRLKEIRGSGHHQAGAVCGHVPGKIRCQLIIAGLLVIGEIHRNALDFIISNVLVPGQSRRLTLEHRRANERPQIVMAPVGPLKSRRQP